MSNARTSTSVARPEATAWLTQVRVAESLGRVAEAPDAPRQGATPSRPSMRQIAFYLLPGGGFWEDPRLGAKLAMPTHVAATPAGDLFDDSERNNIARPASVPYAAAIVTWDSYPDSLPGG